MVRATKTNSLRCMERWSRLRYRKALRGGNVKQRSSFLGKCIFRTPLGEIELDVWKKRNANTHKLKELAAITDDAEAGLMQIMVTVTKRGRPRNEIRKQNYPQNINELTLYAVR